mmetsp:Transcript_10448/g.15369  ORF Transcript_10448/g.15369 Transcript_10448/m.15369 type:complete len:636 (-) Transcript_10448:325-2232(-)
MDDCVFDMDEDQHDLASSTSTAAFAFTTTSTNATTTCKNNSFPKRYMYGSITDNNGAATTSSPEQQALLSSSLPTRPNHHHTPTVRKNLKGIMKSYDTTYSPMTTKFHPRQNLANCNTNNNTPQHNRSNNKRRSISIGSESELLPPLMLPQLPVQQQPSRPTTNENENNNIDKDDVDKNNDTNPFYISFVYGFINACIILPVLMSFANIIYRDEAFRPYLPVLIKLTIVSGVVHQLCFSTFSSLPFAIGQVQDAGLIFLSSMATSLVQYCQSRGHSDEVLLATVTIGLSLSTALLGLGLIGIGKLQLAQYVQMLPTPVIGGYLAFIGYFCGGSGIGIMTPKSDDTNDGSSSSTSSWQTTLCFVLPGVVGGIGLYVMVRRIRHIAVLPCGIGLLLLSFYVVLSYTDTTVAEATEAGWISKTAETHNGSSNNGSIFDIWQYLQFDKVDWAALPSCCTLTLFSMIFVVALSSSLDVAAIELELNRPLNYNSELCMVGLSNVLSGLTGGYTGSYIFSQSIFSLRAGITSRWSGYCLVLLQLIILLLPFPLLSYVPNFFFGALLILICMDLMVEWLWEVRTKLTPVEYMVCLSTFLFIPWLGVEFGILAGVGLQLFCDKVIVPYNYCGSGGSSMNDEEEE